MVWEYHIKIKVVKFYKMFNDIYPLNEYLFTQISLKSFPMLISEVGTKLITAGYLTCTWVCPHVPSCHLVQ